MTLSEDARGPDLWMDGRAKAHVYAALWPADAPSSNLSPGVRAASRYGSQHDDKDTIDHFISPSNMARC